MTNNEAIEILKGTVSAGSNDLPVALDMAINAMEKLEKLEQHFFEISYALDSQSAKKAYQALRTTHYDNQQWIQANGFQDKYYKYFVSKLSEENDVANT